MGMSSAATLEDLSQEASRILEFVYGKGMTLRLLGGVAINIQCPSARRPPLMRKYGDLDFVAHQKQAKQMKTIFPMLGYAPREIFNALQGHSRLIFNDLARSRRIDIFLDKFEMCHRLDFTDRLELEEKTLPLADLLATKLQVMEINEKDIKDILSLFLDYEVLGDSKAKSIDGGYLARLCSDDWGLYRTLTTNLEKIQEALDPLGLDNAEKTLVLGRIEKLVGLLQSHPKSLRWKLRARVGEKVRWYELPASDNQVFDR